VPFVAGVDIGSVTTKAVILDCAENNEILSYHIVPSEGDVVALGRQSMEAALRKIKKKAEVKYIVATGYGRVSADFANSIKTEILCHGKGAHAMIPSARTVIDIGGQDSKAIRLDEEGNLIDFAMNDKCAAGTGRFLETIARALGMKVTHLAEVAAKAGRPCEISSTCTVFAESEVVTLRAHRNEDCNIVAGLHRSISKRVVAMVKTIKPKKEIVFTGGVAKNEGVKKALEAELDTEILVPEYPQIVGAYGAALIAKEEFLAI
jgi:CoA-substrate-specific enzyme activase, putative